MNLSSLQLAIEIAGALAQLGQNPAFGSDVHKASFLVTLAGKAFAEFGMLSESRVELLRQIRRAVAEGRSSLTDAEQQEWLARYQTANAMIDGWAPEPRDPPIGI